MFVGQGAGPRRQEVALVGQRLGAPFVTQSARCFPTRRGVGPNVRSTEGGQILTDNLFDRCAEGGGRRTDAATGREVGTVAEGPTLGSPRGLCSPCPRVGSALCICLTGTSASHEGPGE